MPARDWWRGAVVYQIYPLSFADANGDGVGDLAGITAKLDYVTALGVDAVWISPFFRSPMKDFGYDVSDHRAVDPLFGTIEDFERLLDAAHDRGLKVLLDFVLNHTSDAHPWFSESRRSRDNPKADWYVWADAGRDGAPPNNWLSVFGGSAWSWEPGRGQYYLHNFLSAQPDLNYHNPAVVDAVLEEAEFWLRRGVDGFRLDAVSFCFHDRALRDNPPRRKGDAEPDVVRPWNPYSRQHHVYDKTRPETIPLLRRIRGLMERYPGTTTIGEATADDSLACAAEYARGSDRLHMAYPFSFFDAPFAAPFFRRTVERMEHLIEDGWPCWSFGNHDFRRAVTRWGGPGAPDAFAKLLIALLLTLRGTVCLYQGEELGLPEAEIPRERLKDPYGIAFWPDFAGRDGCRTPMPWVGADPKGGFSAGEPWLPVPPEHLGRAVDVQERDPGSVLNAARRFIAWRKRHPALVRGDIRFLDAPAPLLAFERACADEGILAAFNLGRGPAVLPLCKTRVRGVLKGHGLTEVEAEAGAARLPPYGVFFAALGTQAEGVDG